MRSIEAGRLRHLVDVESENPARDAYGNASGSWSVFAARRPASIEPLRARERLEAGRAETVVTHKIRMRWMPGITSDMRIVWGSRVFHIHAVIDIEERRRVLEVMAEEVKP